MRGKPMRGKKGPTIFAAKETMKKVNHALAVSPPERSGVAAAAPAMGPTYVGFLGQPPTTGLLSSSSMRGGGGVVGCTWGCKHWRNRMGENRWREIGVTSLDKNSSKGTGKGGAGGGMGTATEEAEAGKKEGRGRKWREMNQDGVRRWARPSKGSLWLPKKMKCLLISAITDQTCYIVIVICALDCVAKFASLIGQAQLAEKIQDNWLIAR
eukprot:554889-Hanusia_phi.AAC.4